MYIPRDYYAYWGFQANQCINSLVNRLPRDDYLRL